MLSHYLRFLNQDSGRMVRNPFLFVLKMLIRRIAINLSGFGLGILWDSFQVCKFKLGKRECESTPSINQEIVWIGCICVHEDASLWFLRETWQVLRESRHLDPEDFLMILFLGTLKTLQGYLIWRDWLRFLFCLLLLLLFWNEPASSYWASATLVCKGGWCVWTLVMSWDSANSSMQIWTSSDTKNQKKRERYEEDDDEEEEGEVIQLNRWGQVRAGSSLLHLSPFSFPLPHFIHWVVVWDSSRDSFSDGSEHVFFPESW